MYVGLVVGVFRSRSEADNARHRLVSEGVEATDIIEQGIGTDSATTEPLTEDLRFRYRLMPPGEDTLVAVRVPNSEQAQEISSILMMFEPKLVDQHELVAGRLPV
jgi:hypothetical protein